MASNIDLTTPLTSGSNTGYLPNRANQLWAGPPSYLRRRTFTVGGPEWGGVTPAAADTIKCFPFGIGDISEQVFTNVVVGFGAACNFSVGDSGGATQYLSAVSAQTAGNTQLAAATTAKWYSTTADYLLITIGATAATGVQLEVGCVVDSVIPYTNE